MFKLDGFDDMERKLKKMQKKANDLNGEQEIPFNVLFNSSFMIKYTTVSSFEEFLEKGGFVVNTPEDFANIPDDVFDAHVIKETRFDSWQNMMEEATGAYVAKQLGFK